MHLDVKNPETEMFDSFRASQNFLKLDWPMYLASTSRVAILGVGFRLT